MKLFYSFTFSLILLFYSANRVSAQQILLNGEKETPPSLVNFSLPNQINLKPNSVCNPACTNMGFEDGTLNGWDAYYATNTSTSSIQSFTGLTGGPAGPVTQAAFDPNPKHNDYQVTLMTRGGVDSVAGGKIPLTPPLGGLCARVGDSTIAQNGVARLEQTFTVDPSVPVLTLQYAALLMSAVGHTGWIQAWMKIELLDQSGNPINTCASLNVSAKNLYGWDSVMVASSSKPIYVKPWTVTYIPLSNYVGQCVTLRVTVSDCAEGGHYGYAYIAASCSKGKLYSSSKVFCAGQTSATITGPPLAATYNWVTPNGCISGRTDSSSINVTCAGTYSVIVTSSAGATCSDTLSMVLPASSSGPPPVPCFSADTVCLGSATSFNATCSTSGANPTKYFWDYYGSGGSTFNDSTSGASPAFTYSLGAVYKVRLYIEDANGCGATVTNPVVVKRIVTDSMPTVTYTTQDASQCDSANGKVFVKFSGASSSTYFNFSGCTITETITLNSTKTLSCVKNLDCTGSYSGYFGCGNVTYTVSGLAPGVYQIYVRPPVVPGVLYCNPLGWYGDTITVVVGPVISLGADYSVNNTQCGKSDGSICVSPAGGIPPYTYQWFPGGATTACLNNIPAGTYMVEMKDASGCIDTLSATVNTTTAATQPTISQSGNILTSSNTTAFSYQWYINNTPLSNSNSYQYSATQDGCYKVMITEANGCVSTSDAKCIILTGIAEHHNDVFHIYPNPNNGTFMITFSKTSDVIVKIFNPLGSEVYQKVIKSGAASKTFSLNLSPGIYFVEAAEEGRHQISKLIIR